MSAQDDMTEETRDALEMMGAPVIQYEPPGQQVVETELGYETVETLGWVKFSAAFRNKALKKLKGAKLSVFISISLHVNNNGVSFPGIDTIAAETGYSRDEVMDTIAELEAIPGLLLVDRKRGRKNVYTPSYVAFGRHKKPVEETTTSRSFHPQPVEVSTESSRGFLDSKKSQEEIKKIGAIAPKTIEEHKARVRQAVTNGIARHEGFTAEIESQFAIRPNWNTSTNRSAIQSLKEQGATKDGVEAFKQWWYANDFRGKQGQPPNPSLIAELWPQAFKLEEPVSNGIRYV